MSDCSTHAYDVQLKPCPFCGGEAELVESDYGMFHTGYAVYCRSCCTKVGVTGRLGETYEWTPIYDTEAEAIAAWNSRAERTCERIFYKPTGVLVCSGCGAGMPKQLDKYCYLHYCPNCGARVVVE